MGLITNVFIIVIAVIIILIAAKSIIPSAASHVTLTQALNNVTSYLKTSYPGASINITSINSSASAGSWSILASVITNSSRACPSYFVLSFDYPQYQFVSRVQNTYTSYVNESGTWVCKIGGLQSNAPYQVPSSPAAIALSYNVSTSPAKPFVAKYGYPNVTVYANYANSLVLDGVNYTNMYMVNYTSPLSNHTVSIVLNQYIAPGQQAIAYSFNTSKYAAG